MEEPWDELMGPSPEDLKNMLNSDPPPPAPPAAAPPMQPAAATAGGPPPAAMFQSSPPPAAMFNQLPERWNDSTPSTAVNSSYTSSSSISSAGGNARRNLAFEDEAEDEAQSVLSNNSTNRDAAAIRQEALKVLEVADDHLADSSYQVHRTATGGFTAAPRAALKGLQYTAKRENSNHNNYPPTQEDYEYADNDTVVDVVGMERRSMASRTQETAATNKWSSRYSTDSTLLALSGGAVTSSKLLDKMDRQNHQEATARNNIFHNSLAKTPQVFGSGGFSFRKKQVFGKQNVAMPTENLRTVWMDVEDNNSHSLPPANHQAKSWQEQLQQKRRQRRRYILGAAAICVFVIGLASLLGAQNRAQTELQSEYPADHESVTFYAGTGAPSGFNWDKVSPQTAFVVHLGNLQDASETLCKAEEYTAAANALKESPVTTFVLPGPEDVNNCPSPSTAWSNWKAQFHFFHRHFEHDFHVQSQLNHNENFAALHDGVLFVGVHLVADVHVVADDDENFDVDWVLGMLKVHAADARSMVILGNVRPSQDRHDLFFDKLTKHVEKFLTDKPVAYVYPGSTSKTRVHLPSGQDAYTSIEVGKGLLRRINVGFGSEPFILG